jgi:chromosome segregation ATPase
MAIDLYAKYVAACAERDEALEENERLRIDRDAVKGMLDEILRLPNVETPGSEENAASVVQDALESLRTERDGLAERCEDLKEQLGDREAQALAYELANTRPAAKIEQLTDDVARLKRTLLRDEESIVQWEKRAREAHHDMMRVVDERDRLTTELATLHNDYRDLVQLDDDKCGEELRREQENVRLTAELAASHAQLDSAYVVRQLPDDAPLSVEERITALTTELAACRKLLRDALAYEACRSDLDAALAMVPGKET